MSNALAAVVLAAGGGRRYGMPKALVEYEGSLLVERAVRTARAVCDPVLVVLGAQAVDVWQRADLDGATVLANENWETGMASSLHTGLHGLRGWPGRVDAALFLLVDMPGMTTDAVRKVAELAAPDVLAVATYDGVHVVPGGELPRDLGDHVGGGGVADVLELGHRPSAVVVPDDAAEADDGAGPFVGHGVLVLGDRERFVDDACDEGIAHGATVPGGTSRSAGSASPVQSTSVTSCAARYRRAPSSPVAVSITPAQCSRPRSTGCPRTPS